ncbi:hypothetical protein DH2020_039459 [Rehmannia glutinosa]|uniref:Uncharacterized protein n=1 Tax=Rehmannia glutinosa TaxID=99300 RepID=A0ABR0UX23_REHGL
MRFYDKLMTRSINAERGFQPGPQDGHLQRMICDRHRKKLCAQPPPYTPVLVKKFYTNARDPLEEPTGRLPMRRASIGITPQRSLPAPRHGVEIGKNQTCGALQRAPILQEPAAEKRMEAATMNIEEVAIEAVGETIKSCSNEPAVVKRQKTQSQKGIHDELYESAMGIDSKENEFVEVPLERRSKRKEDISSFLAARAPQEPATEQRMEAATMNIEEVAKEAIGETDLEKCREEDELALEKGKGTDWSHNCIFDNMLTNIYIKIFKTLTKRLAQEHSKNGNGQELRVSRVLHQANSRVVATIFLEEVIKLVREKEEVIEEKNEVNLLLVDEANFKVNKEESLHQEEEEDIQLTLCKEHPQNLGHVKSNDQCKHVISQRTKLHAHVQYRANSCLAGLPSLNVLLVVEVLASYPRNCKHLENHSLALIAEDESHRGNAKQDVGDLNDICASSTPRSAIMANRKVTIVKAVASNSSNTTSESLGVISKKLQAPSKITPLLGITENESLQGNTKKDVGDLKDMCFINSSLGVKDKEHSSNYNHDS